jgi:predicted GNAT family N-acyltransferase
MRQHRPSRNRDRIARGRTASPNRNRVERHNPQGGWRRRSEAGVGRQWDLHSEHLLSFFRTSDRALALLAVAGAFSTLDLRSARSSRRLSQARRSTPPRDHDSLTFAVARRAVVILLGPEGSLLRFRRLPGRLHIAYSSVGKADPTSRPEVMADGFDTGARILCARHGSRLVGTARLALPSATERTEYDEFVRVPEWVDRRSLAVLSRIATDAAYRGANLLYSLVLRCVAEAASHDRRFILGGCTDALLPVYERVGARTTGLIFRHGQLANTQENLIVFDSHEILKGRGVRPDLWQEVLQPMNGRRG